MGLVTIIGGFILKLIEIMLGSSGGVENSKVVEQNKKLREKLRQQEADKISERNNVTDIDTVKAKIVKEDDDEITINPSAGFSKLPKP